jgi:hypothetical protein
MTTTSHEALRCIVFCLSYLLIVCSSSSSVTQKEKIKKGNKRKKSKSAKGPTGNEMCNEMRENERTKKEIGIQPVYGILLCGKVR